MELEEAKKRFINAWGVVGVSWGINKTMAQIHALLLVTEKPLSYDDIMDQLQISRGNTNLNVRSLMDWGLVYKEYLVGERREYFRAEKDIYQISRKILHERRKREIYPLMDALNQLKDVKSGNKQEVKQFKSMVDDIYTYSAKMDSLAEKYIRSDENWLYKTLLKMA